MTRENKLALVVGFGLILFIGILISDHFSVVRNQVSANLTNRDIEDPLAALGRNEPDLIALKPEPPPTPPLLQADPAVNASQMAANPAAQQPIESMSPEQRSMVDRHASLPRTAGLEQAAPVDNSASAASNSADQSPLRDVQPVNTLDPQSGSAEITTLASRQDPDIEIPGFIPVDDDGMQADVRNVQFHDVRGGESLFAICKQYYGDISLVNALAKFNKMSDPGQVRAGRRLAIPTPEALGGKAAKSAPAAAPSKPSALRPTSVASNSSSTKPVKKSTKTYTVKDGDSLSTIAQRVLGDREKWRDLHKINRGVISDPDNIKTGTVLKLG